MKLELSQTLVLPTGVLGLASNAEGTLLYAACMDGGIHEVDAISGKVTRFAEGHQSYASGCVLLPGDTTLISGGYDGRLLWHDVATRKLLRTVKAHDFWSWQMACSSDGRRLASVSGQYLVGGEKYEPAPATQPTVKVFDTQTGELLHAFLQAPPVQSVAFSPDGRYLAAGNMMGEVTVWDLMTARVAATFQSPDFTSWGIIKSPHYIGGIFGLTFSPEGADLLLCGMGPMTDPMAGNGKMTWQRWSWKETPAKRTGQIRDGEHGSGLMEAVRFAPDGKAFVVAGRQAQGTWNAALFGAEDGKLLASFDTKSRITRSLFTASGTTLILGASVSQGARKDGKWPEYGRIHLVQLKTPA